MKTAQSNDVSDYIRKQKKEIQPVLKQLRTIILKNAPAAEEVISYGMPGYRLNGMLVYFAAFKNHVSLFVTASALMKEMDDELKKFSRTKSAIHFPHGTKLPLRLINKIIKFRIKENEERNRKKKKN